MNRLEKKCMIAATGFHLLLLLLLVIGPGFLSRSTPAPELPLIDFVPVRTVDNLMSGGGDPKGGTPPPALAPRPATVAAPPVPAPKPEPAPEPAPKVPVTAKPAPKEPVVPKEDSFSTQVSSKPKPKPEISTTLVQRDRTAVNQAAKAKADAERRAAQERAEAMNRLAQAVERIGGGLSGNFLQGVKKIYSDAWIVPDGIKDDTATVEVSVTIARDGSVVSSRIVNRSGDPAVNQSVQMTLDRVRRVVPLPEDSTQSQRTVTITFNVKAKLLG
jgi:TonB family protein